MNDELCNKIVSSCLSRYDSHKTATHDTGWHVLKELANQWIVIIDRILREWNNWRRYSERHLGRLYVSDVSNAILLSTRCLSACMLVM